MDKRRRTFIIKSKEKEKTMGRKQVESEYWICIMGGTHSKNLPAGADFPLRRAAINAFALTTKEFPETCSSGWGSEKEKVDVLKAVWSMDDDDPLYIAIKAMLKDRI